MRHLPQRRVLLIAFHHNWYFVAYAAVHAIRANLVEALKVVVGNSSAGSTEIPDSDVRRRRVVWRRFVI